MTTTRKNPGRASGASEESAAGGASGVDDTKSLSSYVNLNPDHAAELAASAIPPAVAKVVGLHTASEAGQLPAGTRWIADRGGLPALVYPMREVDGTETCQVRPRRGAIVNDAGREQKYIGPSKTSGHPPQLPLVGVVLDDGSISTDRDDLTGVKRVWIVEGCKQALAALAHTPAGTAVFRIAGVWSWRCVDDAGWSSPSPFLAPAVGGRDVVVFGDADAATNINVYEALAEFGEALCAAGASSVAFARVPGAATDGVDDVLASLPESDRRPKLQGWADGAGPKPASLTAARIKAMRAERARIERIREVRDSAVPGRVDVELQNDWHLDCVEIADIAVGSLGGRVLFRRGDETVEVYRGDGGVVLRRVDLDALHRLTLSVVRLIIRDKDGDAVVPGLKRDALGILRGHVADALPLVGRISPGPVVRSDGSMVTASGYDPQTAVLLDLAPAIEGVVVPEHPTDAQVASATSLLRDVLFERDLADGYDGWVFEREADRTHAIALLLTCFLRSAFPVVPLALLNGLQRGVGKGELLQVIHQIAYGAPAPVKPMSGKDEEVEKRISSDFLAGLSMIVLDEVMGEDGKSRLRAPSLISALTAPVWAGRRLGRSEAIALDQDAVWAATGNNVDLSGDILRRLFQIRLASDRPGLEDRSNFRHDLGAWVPEHRAELVVAALTLIRAWYDRGQPEAPRPFGFVGFTEWQRVIGGILHLAGIEDFLAGVREMRSAEDSEAVANRAHLAWVEQAAATLPDCPRFTAKEILAVAASDADSVAPYDRAFSDLDARGLGRVWKSMSGRWFGDLRVVEDGRAHGNVTAWRVQSSSATSSAPSSTPSSAAAPSPGPRPAAGASAGEVIEFADRKGFRREAARAMPPINGLTIAELGGGDPA